MTKPMQLQKRTVVVTGAASGIGRALAITLAGRGCHLALADIDTDGLAKTVNLIGHPDLCITQHRLDVGDPVAVAAFPDVVRGAHPGVDVLINNAGVALGGQFEQVSATDFEWLIGINFLGVVRMTRAFLPMLKASDDARLVNLSSVFGLVAFPGQTAYTASKFAVRGFSESLRHELEGTTVGVTVVHPGGVKTSIADNARIPADSSAEQVAQQRDSFKRSLRLSPAIAAETIVRGIEQRRVRVLVGNDARLLAFMERIRPTSYWPLIKRTFSGG